jgi:hypothetical protein
MKTWRLTAVLVTLLLALPLTSPAFAHVGSPDVYFESDAGPYRLLISVNPPPMIPGVAQVQIHVESGNVESIAITPVYVNGKDQGLPPAPDAMQPSAADSHGFAGKVWLMESGSWELRTEVTGSQGIEKLAVPVPAYARRTLPMQRGLGVLLFGLMLALAIGLVSIAGAAAREGVLAPAVIPSTRNLNHGRIAMIVAAVFVVSILALGNWWWNAKAADLKQSTLYNAPRLDVSLHTGQLMLRMEEDFWHQTRKDQWSMSLIPDHGHLMHLFLLRVPAMDRFYHLHPEQINDGSFTATLPAVSAGRYKIFADIVRGTGFPETMVSEINLPDLTGQPLSGDDSEANTSAFETAAQTSVISELADGSRMFWQQDGPPLKAGQVSWLRFRIEDAQHKPVNDIEPYMGMAGHAEFVKSDFSVFAHIHPAGSAPMASLLIAQKDAGLATNDGAMDHASTKIVSMDHATMGHNSTDHNLIDHNSTKQNSIEHSLSLNLSTEVSFPYGFPQPGDYRLFIQIKRHGLIDTGVFDVHVQN